MAGIMTNNADVSQLAASLKMTLPDPKTVTSGLKPKGNGGEVAGPCPKCGGRDRFFIRADGSFMCRQCDFKGGDSIDFFKLIEGTDFIGLAKKYLNSGNGGGVQTGGVKKEQKLPPASVSRNNLKNVYNYTDENGDELFRVHRYEEPGREKTFRQGHIGDDGKFVFGIKEIRRVLYNLPEIATAQQVVVVEGEKDADQLSKIGIVATTSPMGASNWKPEYADFLKDKDVIIVPDNDKQGQQFGNDVAGSVLNIARSIKVVKLPGLREQEDVSDWFDSGGTKDQLEQLITEAPEFEPLEAPDTHPATQSQVGGAVPPTARSISEILGGYSVSNDYVNGLGSEEWLYDNLLIKNHILTVIAKSGGGKTTFFFYHVSRELSQKGYTAWYIDADSPPSDHKKMKQFADQHGINFLIPDLNEGRSIETLIKDLTSGAANQADLKNSVFIFDTLKKFADLMSKNSVKELYTLLRKLTKLGATVVLLAHANKYPDKEGNFFFKGSAT